MQWAPDPTDLWAPDSERAGTWALDSSGHLTLIQAVDLFLAAKAAEGVSPKTSTWYRKILARLTKAFDSGRPIDGLSAPEIRAWLLDLRTTLAPVSIAGYVRTLKAFGNWLQAECLAEASAFRGLRRPRVPVKIIEPVPDDTLRRLLGLATVRDRAILIRCRSCWKHWRSVRRLDLSQHTCRCLVQQLVPFQQKVERPIVTTRERRQRAE